ncbi:putative deoxycytidine triphosphate deaminase [Bacillus phage vB_BspM_AgentSmith]|nr:putative deoxycytidine triphosphate deaminase [Bacillus phage vB_BspM_AgentSmith]
MIMSDKWLIKNLHKLMTGGSRGAVRYVDRETGIPLANNFQMGRELPGDARRVVSYGVSSYGYDVRLDNNVNHIRIFSNVKVTEINPKKMSEDNFYQPTVLVDEDGGEYVLIPPHSYLQAPTVEYFDIPRDIMVVVLGKSTYARSGVVCNVTPIEPGFQGNVVIELANVTSSHVRCYLNEGVAQFLFFQGNEPCGLSYADKGGKYQGQTGMTMAKV